jgi:hypothetical protein
MIDLDTTERDAWGKPVTRRRPLRALTPLQDKILTLLVLASNRPEGRDHFATWRDLSAIAERMFPKANGRTIARRVERALNRLESEGVAGRGLDLPDGCRCWRLVRSLPAAATISLLYSKTGDAERRRERIANAPSKRLHAQPGNELGRATVDAQCAAESQGPAAPVHASPRRDGGHVPMGPGRPAGSETTAPGSTEKPFLERNVSMFDPEHVPNERRANGAVSDSRPGQEAPATTRKD